MRRLVLDIAISLGAAAALFAASMRTAIWVAQRTHSGLFGICGPYGDERAIYTEITLLALALVGAPALAAVLFFGRRASRAYAARMRG